MDLTPAAASAPPIPRMTLLDLMGLVVACAVWLAGWLFFRQPMRFLPDGPGRGGIEENLIPSRLFVWLQLGSLLAVTLAAMSLIRGLKHLRRRPPTFGSVACLATLLSVSMDLLIMMAASLARNHFFLRQAAHRSPLERFDFLYTFMDYLVAAASDRSPIGKMILVGWSVQVLWVGWQRSSSWLDYLGRAIGGYYLLAWGVEVVVKSNHIA